MMKAVPEISIQNRKGYISHLRIAASFAVVMLHASAYLAFGYNAIETVEGKILVFFDSIVRFGVPVFLMISGAVLLNKDEKINVFLTKRFKRILLPFLFWTLVYYFFSTDFSTLNFKGAIVRFVANLFKGAEFRIHFWYIYLILGLYLFLPILRKWTVNATKKELLYFIFIWSVTLFINKHTVKYFPDIELMYFSKYLGYMVLGYFLDKYLSVTKRTFIVAVLLIATGILATYYLTIYVSPENKFFFNFLAPNVALVATGIFILFKSKCNKPGKITETLATTSYGIYFVHMLILWNVGRILKSTVIGNNLILYVIISGITTYFVSFFIVYFLSRIGFLKRFVT